MPTAACRQDELALAKYEAQKWKEKFIAEKQRRRAIAKSLLDLMAVHERRSPTENSSARLSASSVFSDFDHIGTVLSPTLSSFDFDDDDDDDDDESKSSSGDSDGSSDVVNANGNHDLPSSPLYSYRSSIGSYPSPSAVNAMQETDTFNDSLIGRSSSVRASRVRPNRSSTTGSLQESVRSSAVRRDDTSGVQTAPPQSLIYRMMYSKSSTRDLWQARSHPTKFSTIARSLMFSMHLRKERVFENFFVAGLTIGATERAHAAKNAAGFVGFWKPRVLFEYPHVRQQ